MSVSENILFQKDEILLLTAELAIFECDWQLLFAIIENYKKAAIWAVPPLP